MTLEEEMAVAVLKGEKDTALILAQKLMEEHVIGTTQIGPIKTLTIPAGRKRLILTLQPEMIAHTVDVDYEGVQEQARAWLNAENDDALVLIGFNFHLFVEPEPKREAHPKDVEQAIAISQMEMESRGELPK